MTRTTTDRPVGPRTTVRSRAGITIPALLLIVVAGCASLPMTQDAQPSTGPVVVPLEDGRQGFKIEEHFDVDGETRGNFAGAVDLIEADRYDEAIALLEQVLEHAPELTAAHVNIALAYERRGEMEKAEEHLRTALELFPGYPPASNTYGLLLRKNGRFVEAREIFETSLERFPEYLPARKNLGILCELYLRDPAAALEHYEIYNEAAPEEEQVMTWVVSLRQRLESPE